MKFKKAFGIVLTFALAFVMLAVPTPTKAGPGLGPNGTSIKVLVLILPNAAVDRPNQIRTVTTMHYSEIEKVKGIAEKMNTWKNGHMSLYVDVKVDYTPIQTTSFSMAYGHAVRSGNIEKQIKANSTNGQYDTIITVYRDTDGAVSLGSSLYHESKNAAANGASYVAFPLKDADHSLSQFNVTVPECYFVESFLDSAYYTMKSDCPELKAPYFWGSYPQTISDMKSYMYAGDNTTMTPYWYQFSIK